MDPLQKIGFHVDDWKEHESERLRLQGEEVERQTKALAAKVADYEKNQLRDQFAMAALTGIWASESPEYEIGDLERIAAKAYAQADAMLKAREKREVEE